MASFPSETSSMCRRISGDCCNNQDWFMPVFVLVTIVTIAYVMSIVILFAHGTDLSFRCHPVASIEPIGDNRSIHHSGNLRSCSYSCEQPVILCNSGCAYFSKLNKIISVMVETQIGLPSQIWTQEVTKELNPCLHRNMWQHPCYILLTLD